jgi:predicted O-methyltransferase YrrM
VKDDAMGIRGKTRRLPESIKPYAIKSTMPARRLLSRSRMWRLWRSRNLYRRAHGPLDDVQNEWSVIAAPSPAEACASDELVSFVLRAVQSSREVDLKTLRERRASGGGRPGGQPGPQYRVLAGLAQAWQARRIVEIGTFLGGSALAMLEVESVEHLTTYDLVPWDDFAKTTLRSDDFGPRLEQRIRNLGEPDLFAEDAEDLAAADMIFLDASKDGVFEPTFLAALFATEPKGPQLLVLDDIRVLTMIRAWREIPHDKFDLTSFGNWAGTGVVVRGGFPPGLGA